MAWPDSPEADQTADAVLALEALDRAAALDPNWISMTTLDIRWMRSQMARGRAAQFSTHLELYEWLLSRTPEMLEMALDRPTLLHYAPDSIRAIQGPPQDRDQGRARLCRLLHGGLQRCEVILDMHLSNGREPLPAQDIERYQRLKAQAREHWIRQGPSQGQL